MVLSDMGAEVVRIDRVGGDVTPELRHAVYRGRRSAAVDLKHPDGVATVLRLAREADVVIEGFRPGVAERLGVGPEECRGRNPGLVYGRVTGWGQSGPLASTAGHDVNYIALSGALGAIGPADRPPVHPVNLLGDYGGGGMLLAFGIVCALVERARSGLGQVVDAAMVDGAALLATLLFGLRGSGRWSDERGANLLDGGAYFYNVYECADGRHVAVGALEPPFHAELVRLLELDEAEWESQWDASEWPARKARLAEVFHGRTRDEWAAFFAGTDACVTPVLSLDEAPRHPHAAERQAFETLDGIVQPAAAPRLSETPGRIQGPPPVAGEHTDEVLADWGFGPDEVARLRETGAIA
jgi:alpha-methylacyl-CoA racemase